MGRLQRQLWVGWNEGWVQPVAGGGGWRGEARGHPQCSSKYQVPGVFGVAPPGSRGQERVPPPGCPPGCPVLPSPATQATSPRFLLCAIPENSTKGAHRWRSTACKCEVPPPTHAQLSLPLADAPFREGLQVGGGDRLDGFRCRVAFLLCLILFGGNGQKSHRTNWAGMAVSVCPPESGWSCQAPGGQRAWRNQT